MTKTFIPFEKFAIKVNEIMRDILKYGYKLSFLYNPSNAEFSNNYSALKNSEFADESSKDTLRAGTMKESLAKTSGNRSTVSVNKRKRF